MKLKGNKLKALITVCILVLLPDGMAASGEIQWHSFTEGVARGKFEKKKVFLHFYADWCVFCKEMEQKTFTDPAIIGSLNENFIPIRVDAERDQETSSIFRIQGLPDTWFLAEDGEIIGHRPGFISADQLKQLLDLVLNAETQQ